MLRFLERLVHLQQKSPNLYRKDVGYADTNDTRHCKVIFHIRIKILNCLVCLYLFCLYILKFHVLDMRQVDRLTWDKCLGPSSFKVNKHISRPKLNYTNVHIKDQQFFGGSPKNISFSRQWCHQISTIGYHMYKSFWWLKSHCTNRWYMVCSVSCSIDVFR